MKANELRIGNLVQRNSEIFEADHITILMSHNYEPIPLTPEILEKAGFKNRYNEMCFLYKDNIGGWEYQLNGGIFSVGEEPIKVDVKYLNQLQNLYYALTGEELNIQL